MAFADEEGGLPGTGVLEPREDAFSVVLRGTHDEAVADQYLARANTD